VQGFTDAVHDRGALAVDGVATTPTFASPEALADEHYELQACPTLYPGQTLRAAVSGAPARLLVRVAGGPTLRGPEGALEWRVPDTGGRPIAEVGVQTSGPARLEWLTWDGAPEVTFTRPDDDDDLWRRAWVRAVDHFAPHWREPFRLIQDRGRGLLIQGTRDWRDYTVRAAIGTETVAAAGIAARVQGLRRYLALLLCDDGVARLVREHDGTTVLAQAPLERRDYGTPHALALEVDGARVRATVDEALVLEAADDVLGAGAIALVCERGCLTCDAVTVAP
jgi:hypothetical protein